MTNKIEKFAAKFLSVFFCFCFGAFVEWNFFVASWHSLTRAFVLILILMILFPAKNKSS